MRVCCLSCVSLQTAKMVELRGPFFGISVPLDHQPLPKEKAKGLKCKEVTRPFFRSLQDTTVISGGLLCDSSALLCQLAVADIKVGGAAQNSQLRTFFLLLVPLIKESSACGPFLCLFTQCGVLEFTLNARFGSKKKLATPNSQK